MGGLRVEGTEPEQVQRGGFLILERCPQFSVPMQGRIGTRLCTCLSLPITLLLLSVMEAFPPPPYQSSSAFAYTLVVSAVVVYAAIVVGLVVVAFVASATVVDFFVFVLSILAADRFCAGAAVGDAFVLLGLLLLLGHLLLGRRVCRIPSPTHHLFPPPS